MPTRQCIALRLWLLKHGCAWVVQLSCSASPYLDLVPRAYAPANRHFYYCRVSGMRPIGLTSVRALLHRHMSVLGGEWNIISDAIRKHHPNTPIAVLGGT